LSKVRLLFVVSSGGIALAARLLHHGLAGRDLGRSQPALERRLIALPWLKSVHYSDLRALVQPSRSGSVMTGSGSKPEVSPTFAISPLMPNERTLKDTPLMGECDVELA
jgi:hypothetical protein